MDDILNITIGAGRILIAQPMTTTAYSGDEIRDAMARRIPESPQAGAAYWAVGINFVNGNVLWIRLDSVQNQPTWTPDELGALQAAFDIMTIAQASLVGGALPIVANDISDASVPGKDLLTAATLAAQKLILGIGTGGLAPAPSKTYIGNTTAGSAVPSPVPVATLKADLLLVKADVGLGSVTNDVQLKAASNLADLPSVSTARSNLGLGSAALQPSTAFDAAGAAAAVQVYADATFELLGRVYSFASLTGIPTTIGGYGITDFNSLGDARWSLLAHTHSFASLTAKPTTIAGYGITDLNSLGDARWSLLGHTHVAANITDFNSVGDARWSLLGHTHSFGSLTSKPTTIGGYGITDFNSLGDARWQTIGGGPGGTVTSVAASVPTGLSIAGSPITSSGTLAITYTAGYQGYTSTEATKLSGIAAGATANSADAYLLARANHTGTQLSSTISDFNTAGDARWSLLGHTHAFSSLTGNPTTIAGYGITDFNSLGDARWQTIGGGGGGTVTSVALSVPTGFAVTGSPVTTSGTLALAFAAGYQGYLATEASKLSGIAAGATANSSDAYLLARANHTGTQLAATISDFNATGDARWSLLAHTHTFASLTSKPTTISGYGITDFNSLGDARWDAIGAAAPAGSSGQVQYNNAGVNAGSVAVIITSAGDLNILPPTTDPPAAPTSGVTVFPRAVAGREMAAFIGPSGLDAVIQPFLGRQKIMWAQPLGNSTGISYMGTALSATGTVTAANVATTNLHTSMRRLDYLVTTAATNAIAGFRAAGLQFWLGNAAGLGGFTYVTRYGLATGVATSTSRHFIGMRGSAIAPTDVNPSTLINMFGFGWDSADANIQFMSNSGGTATKVNLGSSFARPTTDRTAVYEATFFSAPNSGTVGWLLTDLVSGAIASGTCSTDLPASTQLLAPLAYYSVGGTSSVIGISLMSLYVETDY